MTHPDTVSTSRRTLRLGTRRSALATAQSAQVARWVEAAAQRAGRPVRVELVEVSTTGDESGAPLTSFGGVGVFVSRLRQALLAGRVDLAVHSLKDLPTAPAEHLVLAAVPAREDPRDVLVGRDRLRLAELAAGARVGTGSPRRAAQLRAARPDLEIVDLRGNVDTRLARVGRDLDAVVLARAGLLRLGRQDEASEVLEPDVMLPAPGQGALAVECRAPQGDRDAELVGLLAALNEPDARAAVLAERTLLAALEAGCAAPLGALAHVEQAGGSAGSTSRGGSGGRLALEAVLVAIDGGRVLRRRAVGPLEDPEGLGLGLAAELLAEGAGDLLAAPRSPDAVPSVAVPAGRSPSGRPASSREGAS